MPPASRLCILALPLTLLGLVGCAGAVGTDPQIGRLAGQTAAAGEGRAQQAFGAARAALEGGDGRSAAALFGEVVAVEPGNDAAQVGLGEALLLLGRADAAAAAFRRALDRAPRAEVSYGFGRAMLAANRPDAAIDELRAATTAAPDDPRFARALGVALDLSGRSTEAQSAYRAALDRHPDDAPLRNNLGLSLALAGDLDEAIRILRRLAEGPGSSPRGRQNLALAYGLAGDDEAAARLATIDLDAADVRSNLALFATLRLADGPRRALAWEPAAGPVATGPAMAGAAPLFFEEPQRPGSRDDALPATPALAADSAAHLAGLAPAAGSAGG